MCVWVRMGWGTPGSKSDSKMDVEKHCDTQSEKAHHDSIEQWRGRCARPGKQNRRPPGPCLP